MQQAQLLESMSLRKVT